MRGEIIKASPQALIKTAEKDFRKWTWDKHFFTLSKEKLVRKSAEEGNIEITKYLLSKGYGGKSFMTAIENQNNVAIKTFLEAGIDCETTNKDGATALSVAAHTGQSSVVQMLIKADADIETRDQKGNTPLFKAATTEEFAIVKMLLKAGANINERNEFRQTALMWAAYKKNPGVVEILLKAGANIELKNDADCTALILAEDVNSLSLLVEAGADLDVKDKGGRRALDWAQKNQNQNEMATLLKTAMDKKLQNKKDLEAKKQTLKSINKWSVSSDQEKEKVFHVTYDSETKTRMKYIFDFNAQILFTEIKSGEDEPNLLEKDFAAVNATLLEKAEQVRKSPPAPRPARLGKP